MRTASGLVLNDLEGRQECVYESRCPCEYAGQVFRPGQRREEKCKSCVCQSGQWKCVSKTCSTSCNIEREYVTTYDGKRYQLPQKCTYIASRHRGSNFTLQISFSEKTTSLEKVSLEFQQHSYVFSSEGVTADGAKIPEFYQSDSLMIFRQSSMYIQVQTTSGIKIQVRISPKIQLYITLPDTERGMVQGLCGNFNNNTMDDFEDSTSMIQTSPDTFALSWSVGDCSGNIPKTCSSSENEEYARVHCSSLINSTGTFAKCHDVVPTEDYFKACVQTTCECDTAMKDCLCVALANYARACAKQDVAVGDWRTDTECSPVCTDTPQFGYDVRACNSTCRSLSGYDPTCEVEDAPVEGCFCREGSLLNTDLTCSSTADCNCHYQGAVVPLRTKVVINNQECHCTAGKLECTGKQEECKDGKIFVQCYESSKSTDPRTCDSRIRGFSTVAACRSGCYCPEGTYEDHNGTCVPPEDCTCMWNDVIYRTGQRVDMKCQTCTCESGKWTCNSKPCFGTCQVHGHGHFQTFDSKWYHFDGNCEYTMVEDSCGRGPGQGTFSIKIESVPCCDESLTCSRRIKLDLLGKITLTLDDLKVTRTFLDPSYIIPEKPLYSVHTVGLYYMISVESMGITLIWDKHTRVSVTLGDSWKGKVCGLCGNFNDREGDDFQLKGSMEVVVNAARFGNSWKMPYPVCTDVSTEGNIDDGFPCKRNSYCAHWAQRRCMLIRSDIFADCKVNPDPYYEACIQESCSCNFVGTFQGFCTAVAAYAEACSEHGVCVEWRTPDRCPVYCDYYNKEHEYSWHYEACGVSSPTCGKSNKFLGKLEGCYPRCRQPGQYFDENTRKCTTLKNCTCFYNETIVPPGDTVTISSETCSCENGTLHCVTPTPECRCMDKHGKTWQCGDEWTDECQETICRNGTLYKASTKCPSVAEPDCPYKTKVPLKDCPECFEWECDCRCMLYGDPHYGIILKYGSNNVTLTVVAAQKVVKAELNKREVELTYEEQGIRFDGEKTDVYVHIDAIRSYVRLTYLNRVEVSVPWNLFNHNTQGQCGVCGGGDCIRRNGSQENGDCCDEVASEWVYPDSQKDYCPTSPPSPPCKPPTTQCSPRESPMCDVIKHKVFSECGKKVDLEIIYRNCRLDLCITGNTTYECSALEQAADTCKKNGFCVEWRHLTNGTCGPPCSNGMVYKECPDNTTNTNYCQGGEAMQGDPTETLKSGCFCPDNKFRAERHKEYCVSTCTTCRGPAGEPMEPGDTWEAGCYQCTCSNVTKSADCKPKPSPPPPTCKENEFLVTFNGTDCCHLTTCVEMTCKYKGKAYKVGERWTDPSQPCVSYICDKSGLQKEMRACAEEQCAQERRVWDKDHCCYTCDQTCSPRMTKVNVSVDDCKEEAELPVCMGQCGYSPRLVQGTLNQTDIFQMKKECQCCQELTSEERTLTVTCAGNTSKSYKYRHITECKCNICT
ncbi:hypothetical protein MATL_G00244420 [Megalops atlanticus]|uniref:Uncharacterized protein n=1 Tax=Megalops atlanticus TaxID=7932 RepID=A0A9D3T0L4_MEGAT|nr:hypothetical protein MATL_G00244420 [Megalops atlanticus]